MLSVNYDECLNSAHYAECRYAKCRYAECRYAECRGAVSVYQITHQIKWVHFGSKEVEQLIEESTNKAKHERGCMHTLLAALVENNTQKTGPL